MNIDGYAKTYVSESLDERLKRWRERLLDLSMNNRLINQNPRKTMLELVAQLPARIEDELQSRPALLLAPSLEHNSDEGKTLAAFQALEQGTLFVDATENDLTSRATELYRVTQQLLADTGNAPLYLSFGVLRWYEDERSEQARQAPLLLVPVKLMRDSVRGPFRLKLNEDDPLVNTALLLKLQNDFGIDPKGLDELPEDDAGVDVEQVLAKIAQAVSSLPRFKVLPLVRLDLISFAKFMMWTDLEHNFEALSSNPIVQRLLNPAAAPIPQPNDFIKAEEIERVIPPEMDLSILDADSTQLAAIHSALAGNSFIIQGPPGTGKSQTITNLIAQAVAVGKTVLFVAEKRAALEVVETRLKNVGLGAFTLEVHSDKSTRAAVVAQLGEPLVIAARHTPTKWREVAAELTKLRLTLNEHALRINEAGPWGESLQQVMGRVLELKDVPTFSIGLPPEPTQEQVKAWRHLIKMLEEELHLLGEPSEHPWRQFCLASWTPAKQQEIYKYLSDLRVLVGDNYDAWRASLSLLGVGHFEQDQLRNYLNLIEHLSHDLPPHVTQLLLDQTTHEIDETLGRLEDLTQEYEASTAAVEDELLPTIYKAPEVDRWREQLMRWAHAFFLLRFFMLFSVRNAMRSYARTALPHEPDLLVRLHHVYTLRDVSTALKDVRDEVGIIFEVSPDDINIDILREAVDFVRVYKGLRDVGGVERSKLDKLVVEMSKSSHAYGTNQGVLKALLKSISQVEVKLQNVDEMLCPQDKWLVGDFDEQIRALDMLIGAISALRGWSQYNMMINQLRERGLGELVALLDRGKVSPRELSAVFERALCDVWINHRFEVEQSLQSFSGMRHQLVVERFRALDEQAHISARDEILARLAGRLPDASAAGQMETIRRELHKKRNHMATRRLFAETRDVLNRLKPVFLMSPQSVARNLDPSLPPFDLVIFDEASQIPPWDAIGAIARGKQLIIVGDTKQLPPTSFFQKDSRDLAEDDIVDMESILDHCIVSGMPEVLLGWHYRSRHQSLIAFSNYHYYKNRLYIFPSPAFDSPHLGVRWCHVPDGIYDRGGSRQNIGEATAVVNALAARALDPATRHQSIGVVTFSMAQQRCIEDLLDRRRRDEPSLEIALNQLHEPLFIKNLESVQGDERDVMMFSIGYGPDQLNRVSMLFGPLNKEGGERRLNVAITRARELLEVYSTLRAQQIDTSRTDKLGVHHLKAFLEYAEHGPQTLHSSALVDSHKTFDSPFEEDVARRLEALGWTIHTQVGVAGYRIDLAVVHPKAQGAYMVGVECDGATYHSAATARDRDRLRQAVLERLGWRIYRIWSTDWWHDSARVLEALHGKLQEWSLDPPVGVETLKPRHVSAPVEPAHEPLTVPPLDLDGPRWPTNSSPYKGLSVIEGGDAQDFYSKSSDRVIIRQMNLALSQGGPVSLAHLTRYIAKAWGLSSITSRVTKRAEELARSSPELKIIDEETVFLEQQTQISRFFYTCDEDPGDRDLNKLPSVELVAALEWIVNGAISLSEEEAIRELGRIFGANRLTKTLRAVGAKTIAQGIEQGLIQMRGDSIVINSKP